MSRQLMRFCNSVISQKLLGSHNMIITTVIRQFRIVSAALKGFSRDNVRMRASALTLYTLLSIVPLLAMALGITRGFGLDQFFTEYLRKNLSEHQEVVNEAIVIATNMLANLRGGFITGIGLIILMWSVIKILGNTEAAFNHIWHIRKPRNFLHKISTYLSLALLTPVLIVVSGSLKVRTILAYVQNTILVSYLSPVITTGLKLFSYSLIWFLLTFAYLILTNTRIKIRSAIFGGVIAGTMFQLLQWSYFMLQGYFTGYGAVYGSFAALPLFLIWLQYSWLIVLWGAELAFTHHHQDVLIEQKTITETSFFQQRLLALLICREVVSSFEKGSPAETASQLAGKIHAHVGLVTECIEWLRNAGILSEIVMQHSTEHSYQPALATEHISVGLVIEKLDKTGKDISGIRNSNVSQTFSDLIDSFYRNLMVSPDNKLLRDL